MSFIPQDIIDKINQVSLDRVMEYFGYESSYRTDKEIFYTCPFHAEKNASFKVDRFPNHKQKEGSLSLAGFYCYGCSEHNPRSKGYGAIMLWAALENIDLGQDGNLQLVVNKLAKMENLVVDGDFKNGFFHRAKLHPTPSSEIVLQKRDTFTHLELRSLGCKVTQVFKRNYNKQGEENAVLSSNGKAIYKYSWNPAYYRSTSEGAPFDSSELIERFNLYPLDRFITEQRDGKSYEVKSTDTYPIFAFCYEDAQGWWVKKYEPYFRAAKEGDPNYKFTYFYQSGKRREGDLAQKMYGDSDVMRALKGDPVETRDPSHPVVQVKELHGNDAVTVTKFKRLVICSGPRDGINVYYHSDAHVCWPHSEGVSIPAKTIVKLRKMANEIIILFDNDKTGIERANKLSLSFLELKTLYLPKDLETQISSRTGKPCKDAEEYFNYYPVVLKQKKKSLNINEHFHALLQSAREKKFWKEKYTERKSELGGKLPEYKYELQIDPMCSFLAAKGLQRYKKDDITKYVYVSDDNKVEIIPDKDIETKAKEIMKNALREEEASFYHTRGLMNTISTARGLNAKTLSEIPMTDLNFNAWGESFDYFYFGNTSVKVTADEIKAVPYGQIPYQVNRKAVLESVRFSYVDMERYFTIDVNPELSKERTRHEQTMYDLRKQLAAAVGDYKLCNALTKQIKEHTSEWKAYEKMYKYRVLWHTPIEQCPPLLQAIYDMSRIFWRKEEAGVVITPVERQMQDAHFINKILALGYMLSRFRTDTRQQMVMVTDYSVSEEGRPSGRNGKTMFAMLLDLVRHNLDPIPGKDFRKDQGAMSQNFQNFQLTVHSSVIIDDLSAGIDAESFYNFTSRLSSRNLYENVVRIAAEESPKIMMTMNQPFNLQHSSTLGRVWPVFVSDYYHEEDLSGEEEKRTPETKFGYHITKSCSEQEKLLNVNLMLYCLQCYFRFIKVDKGVMRPPLGEDASRRLVYQAFKENAMFMDWANMYFANPWHFERPISLREMARSYYEFIQEKSLNRKEIGNDKIAKLKSEVMKYCSILGYVVNPSICFRSDTDIKNNSLRVRAWVTVCDVEGNPVSPRRRELEQCSVMYVYRRGSVPKTSKEVFDAPAEDEELKYVEQP